MTVNSASAEDLTIRKMFALFGGEFGIQHEIGHPDDAVHRRPDLVAHVREKLALGSVRGFGDVFGCPQALLAGAQCRRVVAHHPAGRTQHQDCPDDAQREDDRHPPVVAIGDELTSDEQTLLLVMHVADADFERLPSGARFRRPPHARMPPVGRRRSAGERFRRRAPSPDARAVSALGCGAAVGDCPPSAWRSPPALLVPPQDPRP